jgi:hypothetical protein
MAEVSELAKTCSSFGIVQYGVMRGYECVYSNLRSSGSVAISSQLHLCNVGARGVWEYGNACLCVNSSVLSFERCKKVNT